MEVNPESGTSTPPTRRKIVLGAGVLIGLFLLSFFLPLQDWLLSVMAWLQAFGRWGLVALSASYIVACVLMVPGSILTIGAGFLAALLWPDAPGQALLWGTIAVSVGSVTGATAAFILGRKFFREAIAAKTRENPKFDRLDRAVGNNGLKMVLLVRLSPAFPFNLLNYAMGLTKVRLRDYVLGSWMGMLPGTVMFVYLGTTLSNISAAATGLQAEEVGWGRQGLLFAGLLATILLVVMVTRMARRALNEAVGEEEADD